MTLQFMKRKRQEQNDIYSKTRHTLSGVHESEAKISENKTHKQYTLYEFYLERVHQLKI